MNKSLDNYLLNNTLQWVLLFGIFTERWYELSILLLINFIIFWNTKNFYISKKIILLFAVISLYSIFSIKYIGYTYDRFAQQIIALFLFVVGYYNYFKYIEKDIDSLFSKYLRIIYIIAILGLLQLFVYALISVNIFSFLYDVPTFLVTSRIMRITSILREPSEFSILLVPAFTYILYKKNKNNDDLKYIILLLTAIIFSFSAITYVILVLVIAYKYLFYIQNILLRSIAIIFSIIIILFINSSNSNLEDTTSNVPYKEIQNKVVQTFNAFSDMSSETFETFNLSTYATMTNLWVSINSPMRLSGTGIGTHVQNYKSQYKSEYQYYGLNSEDGYSLAIRIFSEMGFLGLVILFIFLIANFDKRNPINIGLAFLLLSQIIRGGHYFRYGLIMYIFMYYYSGKIYNKKNEYYI